VREGSRPPLFMEREVAWVQCRELRTAGYVSALQLSLVPDAPPAHANPTVSFSNLASDECKAGSAGRDYEPFRQDWSTIGAASGGTASR